MRIADTQACSYRNKDFTTVMVAQEKEKKDKYLASLHVQRKDFTQMVYTVGTIPGRKAKSAEKHLTSFLAET